MTEIERLHDQLARAHARDPWHGPARASVLARVDARQAAAHPLAAAHSIWELVLHMTAWTREVERRLQTGVSLEPTDGDWPAVPDPAGDEAWRRDLAALDAAHRSLLDTIARFPAARLEETLRDDREHADVVTFAELLHGIVQHDVYHTGQVAMLARALGA